MRQVSRLSLVVCPPLPLPACLVLQIFQAAQRELPGLDDDIAAGQFGRLKGWLNEKVHK